MFNSTVFEKLSWGCAVIFLLLCFTSATRAQGWGITWVQITEPHKLYDSPGDEIPKGMLLPGDLVEILDTYAGVYFYWIKIRHKESWHRMWVKTNVLSPITKTPVPTETPARFLNAVATAIATDHSRRYGVGPLLEATWTPMPPSHYRPPSPLVSKKLDAVRKPKALEDEIYEFTVACWLTELSTADIIAGYEWGVLVQPSSYTVSCVKAVVTEACVPNRGDELHFPRNRKVRMRCS